LRFVACNGIIECGMKGVLICDKGPLVWELWSKKWYEGDIQKGFINYFNEKEGWQQSLNLLENCNNLT
jgi:hypothetical protein